MAPKARLILVPTDFSDASFAALEYAVYYANRTRGRILLIHYAQRRELRAGIRDPQAYRQRIRDKQNALRHFKNRSGGAFRIQTQFHITDRSPHDALLQHPDADDASLCCLGTGVGPTLQKYRLGANTLRLIGQAPFPILTCRAVRQPLQFRNLLLPIDLTAHTLDKVDRILQFASLFDSTIHLLAVSEFLEELTASRRRLLERLEEAAADIRQQGIHCTTEVIRHDQVSHSVLDYAQEIRADLLVVMAGQEDAVTSLVLGSRTEKVLAHADIPVISFRP